MQKQPAKIRSTGSCDVEATVKNTSNEHESTLSHALGSEPVKLIPLEYEEVLLRQWVLVIYEEEVFIGRVLNKNKEDKKYEVLCLEKLYIIREPQKMEKEVVWYSTVYKAKDEPELKKMEGSRLYKYIY